MYDMTARFCITLTFCANASEGFFDRRGLNRSFASDISSGKGSEKWRAVGPGRFLGDFYSSRIRQKTRRDKFFWISEMKVSAYNTHARSCAILSRRHRSITHITHTHTFRNFSPVSSYIGFRASPSKRAHSLSLSLSYTHSRKNEI